MLRTHTKPAGILRLQHPPIITRTMPALAAAVANVTDLCQMLDQWQRSYWLRSLI